MYHNLVLQLREFLSRVTQTLLHFIYPNLRNIKWYDVLSIISKRTNPFTVKKIVPKNFIKNFMALLV